MISIRKNHLNRLYMDKLLTIVIPAYNMEALLPRCLDSICTEKVMDKVQVIVVNDGSKDRTLEIARSYESRYPHYIIVIDKSNGNYGSCMNAGLSIAVGKYFRTLDADDWYNTKAYEQFIEELDKTDADMIICERDEFNKNIIDHKRFNKTVKTDVDYIIDNSMWTNKSIIEMIHVSSVIYKTEIVRHSGLKWDEGVYFTDNEFIYWPLSLLQTIRFMPLPVYQYDRAREGQSTSPQNLRKSFNSYYIVSTRILDKFLTEMNSQTPVYGIQISIIKNGLLRSLYMTLFMDGYVHKKEIECIEKKVKKNKDLYNITNDFDDYRNLHYVDAYRHNKLLFWCIRFDYRLRRFMHHILAND